MNIPRGITEKDKGGRPEGSTTEWCKIPVVCSKCRSILDHVLFTKWAEEATRIVEKHNGICPKCGKKLNKNSVCKCRTS